MTGGGSAAGWFGEVLGLVLPVECAGCGRWDVALCPSCRAALDRSPTRCDDRAPALAATGSGSGELPTWAVAPYSGTVRGVVVAWKRAADRALAAAVAEAATAAGRRWGEALLAAGLVDPGERTTLLPAPSGRRRRLQGRFVVGSLAAGVGTGLGAVVGPASVVDGLRRAGGAAHQSGLGALARRANRAGSVRLVQPLPRRHACLLVDDVVTTGATLAACRRALVDAGHDVRGALVLAAAPSPRGHR